MLQIFTTQLTGLIRSLFQKQEEQIEDSARLLTQAITSEGTIHIAAFGEMQAILAEALHGKEPLPQAVAFDTKKIDQLTEQDRVIIATRTSDDEEALALATRLHGQNIPFVTITTLTGNEDETLLSLSDTLLDLGLQQSLVPAENGSRIGYPSSILGLYAYFYVLLTIQDILIELEE